MEKIIFSLLRWANFVTGRGTVFWGVCLWASPPYPSPRPCVILREIKLKLVVCTEASLGCLAGGLMVYLAILDVPYLQETIRGALKLQRVFLGQHWSIINSTKIERRKPR